MNDLTQVGAVRRSVTVATITALAGCLSWPGLTAPAESEADESTCERGLAPWPSYQFDAKNTGASPAAPTFESTPEVARTINSSPQVSGFVVGSDRLYVIDSHEGITAYHRESGVSTWERSLDEIVDTEPALTCDAVVVQTGQSLYAFETEDGETRWERDDGNGVFEPALVVSDDTVFVGTLDVVAVDAATGDERWRTPVSLGDCRGLAADEDTVYAVHTDGSEGAVSAIEREDGTERWTVDGFDHSAVNPVVGDERVFVQFGNGTLVAIGHDGEVDWRHTFETDDGWIGPPALSPDGTLVSVVGLERRVVALEAATGDERWSAGTPAFGVQPPVIGDGIVYADTADGLTAFSLADGEEYWTWTEVNVGAPISADESTLFVAGDRRCTPSSAWRGPEHGRFQVRPACRTTPSAGCCSERCGTHVYPPPGV